MPLDARFPLDSTLRLLVLALAAITAIMLARLTWTLVEPQSVLPAPAPVALVSADASVNPNYTYSDPGQNLPRQTAIGAFQGNV